VSLCVFRAPLHVETGEESYMPDIEVKQARTTLSLTDNTVQLG
jgi:hypothetical protein